MKIDRKPSPQDVTWFLDMANNHKLDLDPAYQRKSIWNNSDREFFLDTVVNNFPCPPVFIHKDIDRSGAVTYRVIDGKQRLLTIIMFSRDEFRVSTKDESNPLAGKIFSELHDDLKKAFWNYTFPVEMINEDNREVLKSIFDRLNRNNKALNPQELRKAKYEGNLQKFIERESEDSYWRDLVRFTKNDFSRMIDHQFICELTMLVVEGKIHGFEQIDIDQFYSENDVEFENEGYVVDSMNILKGYFNIIDSINGVLKDHFLTRSSVYTLWSVFALHAKKLPDPKDIATKLKQFAMELEANGETSRDENVREYAGSNKGATTDRTPREKRAHYLTKYLELK